MRLIKSIGLSVMLLLSLSACSPKKSISDDLSPQMLTSLAIDGQQVTLADLKDDMSAFIIKTYMPVEADTKEDYISPISKYLTESEYDTLLSELGDYNGDIVQSIKELDIHYAKGENCTQHNDKVLCSFMWHNISNGLELRRRINIIFNVHGDKLNSHYILQGETEVQG